MKITKHITGPYAVLMTPFAGEKIDEHAFAEQVKRVNGTGVAGFVTNGSTAEFPFLSLQEQMKMTELTARAAGAGKKLIVSACTANAADTLRLCRHAASVGAEAVLVCQPYYFKYTQAEREAYFTTVADRSPVPVILYNIPFFTQDMELDVVYRMIRHENVWGIKDSSANMKRLMHMIDVAEDTPFSVLTGTDDILTAALFAGCAGSFTAFAAIFPDRVSALYAAMAGGDAEKAKSIQADFMPLLRKADSVTFPKGYKALLAEVMGIPFGDKEPRR